MFRGQQALTQVKIPAVGVGLHSTAEAFLEGLPLVYHGDTDRGVSLRILLWAWQAQALGCLCVHHAAAREVQALALDNVLRSSGIESVLMPQLSVTSLGCMVHAAEGKHAHAGIALRW